MIARNVPLISFIAAPRVLGSMEAATIVTGGGEVDLGFLVTIRDGKAIQSVARIRGLGAVHGMLILRNYDEVRAYLNEVRLAGYAFAVLDESREDEVFDLQSFEEMSQDWGWSRSDEKDSNFLH
jgi:hypothetical protein